MGAGIHSGFGDTFGSKAISLSPTFAGDENNLKTVWIYPNGRMTIGPNARTNTGNWISYYPKKMR